MSDPVHSEAPDSWWFYTVDGSGRFGPYHSEDEARSNLAQYQAWVKSQQPQQEAAPAQAEQQPNDEIRVATERYVQLRDAKAALALQHKEEMAEIENELKQVDASLLDYLNRLGVDSVKTSAGLVHFQTELRAGIGDKGALMDFIRKTGQPELLQSRVSSTVLREFMEANGGNTPPGVSASFERVIRVRKN